MSLPRDNQSLTKPHNGMTEESLKPDSDPIRFQVGVTFENEEAKKLPYKYDPRAKTTFVKANGEVIYTY